MSAPPGWYGDPAGQRQWRWWDGQQWTSHVAAVTPPRIDPRPTVEAEASVARWATWGLAAEAVSAVLTPWFFVRFFRVFQPMFTAPIEDYQAGPSPEMIRSMFGVMAGQQVLSLVSIAAFIAIGIWIYRAASAAAQLGIPARHDPAWAVAGYFIPIINFWWPCQSLQDLLPPGHPTRRTILLVWVPFVLGPFVMMAGLLPTMFVAGPVPLLIVALGAMMTAAGWLSAIRLVPIVAAEHQRLVPS